MPDRTKINSGTLQCDIPGCTATKTFSSLGLSIHKHFAHGISGTSHHPRGKLYQPTESGGPFKCDLCGHHSRTPQALGMHKRLVHGIAGASRPSPDSPFECQVCHRHFKNNHGLSIHSFQMHQARKGKKVIPLPEASNGKPASPGSIATLDEAITALEVKRDALQWVIEDLKRIALSQ